MELSTILALELWIPESMRQPFTPDRQRLLIGLFLVWVLIWLIFMIWHGSLGVRLVRLRKKVDSLFLDTYNDLRDRNMYRDKMLDIKTRRKQLRLGAAILLVISTIVTMILY